MTNPSGTLTGKGDQQDGGQGSLLRPWSQGDGPVGIELWPFSPGPAVLPQTWHGQGVGVSGKACLGVRSLAPHSQGSGGPCPGSKRGCVRCLHGVPPVPPGWGTQPAGARREGISAVAPPSHGLYQVPTSPHVGPSPFREREISIYPTPGRARCHFLFSSQPGLG